MIRLVYYDISETKVRTKLVNLLEYYGFDRIQYSVFAPTTDRIYSHIIEKDNFENMGILGEGLDSEWILHEINVLFI